MKCEDVMLMLVYTRREKDTVADCAELMRDEKIGFVPILGARGDVVGVVTDRDLVVRALAAGKPPTTPLKDVMTTGDLLTCRVDEDLRTLEARMSEQKKGRAIVLDKKGKLAGVISLADIAGAEDSAVRTSKLVREISHRESVAIVRP